MNTKRKTLHINFFSIAGALLFALVALGEGYFLLDRILTVVPLFLDGSVSYMDGAFITTYLIQMITSGCVDLITMAVMGLMAVAMLFGRKNKFLCFCTALLIVAKGVALLSTPIYWLLMRFFACYVPGQSILSWLLSLLGIVAPVALTLFVLLTCFSRKERRMTWAKFVFFLPALVYLVLGLLGIPLIIAGVQNVVDMIRMSGAIGIVLDTVLVYLVSISNFYLLFFAYLFLGAWVAFPKRRKVAKGTAAATCEAFYVESFEETSAGDPS
jgi:hypothetical protein